MKTIRKNIILGSTLLLLIGASLVISTLHSHQHIQWHHPQNHEDTSHCITVDTNLCPICGYLFNAEFEAPSAAKDLLQSNGIVVNTGKITETNTPYPSYLGRAPPFVLS